MNIRLKQIRVDGYKNLIDCSVNLGDFNVIVGSNNSGKTNLLEAVQMLMGICWGSEEVRANLFKGLSARFAGSSVCHLPKYKNRPLTIGIGFSCVFDDQLWDVDYQVSMQCKSIADHHDGGSSEVGFRSELLQAKPVSQTGRSKKYLERSIESPQIVKILTDKGTKVSRKVSRRNCAIQALGSIFADYEGLPPIVAGLISALKAISASSVFAVSASKLRETFDMEQSFTGMRISSFDLLKSLDDLKSDDPELLKLFEEQMTYVLDLEGVQFQAQDIHLAGTKSKTQQRVRLLYIKKKGGDYKNIEEYSDGTLAVAGMLIALLSKRRTGPMLFLEEIENCLHPIAIERMIEFLRENPDTWPVLITTHSTYVLNCVSPDEVSVAVVNKDGAAHFEKIKNKKNLRALLNKGLLSFGELLPSNFEPVLGNSDRD